MLVGYDQCNRLTCIAHCFLMLTRLFLVAYICSHCANTRTHSLSRVHGHLLHEAPTSTPTRHDVLPRKSVVMGWSYCGMRRPRSQTQSTRDSNLPYCSGNFHRKRNNVRLCICWGVWYLDRPSIHPSVHSSMHLSTHPMSEPFTLI